MAPDQSQEALCRLTGAQTFIGTAESTDRARAILLFGSSEGPSQMMLAGSPRL